MNQESPFERYLTGRAEQIEVPGAGAVAIAERARDRRRKRRTGSAAVLGVAVLVGGAVVGQGLRSDDDAQELASYGAGLVESPLDWTTVPVGQGLGWTAGMVQADSGAVYGLSTAPGSYENAFGQPRRLYSSADGTDWSEVALPDGLSANAMAAEGDTIFAVGTSAAGGTIRVQVASSSAPDDGWAVTDLPLDLDAEGAGIPGRVLVSETSTAVQDGRTVVAVGLGVEIDTAQVLPDEEHPDQWYAMSHGMVHQPPVCAGESGEPATTTSADAGAAPADAAPASTTLGDDPGAPKDCLAGEDAVGSETVRSWAELGYGDEVGRLIDGVTRVFVTDETGAFQPATTVSHRQGGAGAGLVAGSDGFWMFTSTWDDDTELVTVHHSPDGLTWSDPPVEVTGATLAVGVLDGRVALVTNEWRSHTLTLHLISGVGVESLDLTEMAGVGPDTGYPAVAGIGPLGVGVAVMPRGDVDAGGPGVVLHSTDGVGFSRTPLPEAPSGHRQTINGLTMTADAVKLRLNLYEVDDDTGTEPVGQQLLVGTPR